MKSTDRIVYYQGVRVFPERVSNIGFTNKTISKDTLLQCKCGSIFQNMKASRYVHKRCAKHLRYFRANLGLSDDDMFEIYRL